MTTPLGDQKLFPEQVPKFRKRNIVDHRGELVYDKITIRGEYCSWKAHRPPVFTGEKRNRGNIVGFSRASRFRMLCLIAGIDWQKVGASVFITLTLPDSVRVKTYKQITDWRTRFWKKLEAFAEREVSAIWRVEWKERRSGAFIGHRWPHMHLLTFGVPFIPYKKINAWWKDVVGIEEYVRTDVRAMNDAEHAAKYAAKYAAKAEECSLVSTSYLDEPVGRKWGTLRKKLIPQFELHLMQLTLNERTMRIKARALDGRPAFVNPADESFTVLGPMSQAILEALRALGIDDCDLPG